METYESYPNPATLENKRHLIQYNLEFIINTIKAKQKGEYKKRFIDVDLPAIDYAEIAKGFGCYSEKITNPEDIKPALQRAIDSGKPSILDVKIAFETPIAMKVIGNLKKNRGLYG